MQLTKEFIFSAALFINALLFIILIVRIKKTKSANIKSKDMPNLTLNDLLEQLPGHIYWKDKNGVALGANHNNWQDFGMSSLNEFIGKTDHELFTKDQADHICSVDQEVMRTGKINIVEESSITFNGTNALYLSHKAPLKNHRGEIIGIIGNSLDITQSKQAALDDLDMLENIISLMPGHVYWMNRDGIYLGCNDNQAKAIGLASRKDIVGKRNVDLPGFLMAEILDPINMKVISTGQPIVIEEPGILPGGVHAIFLSSKAPLRTQRGDIVGVISISIDITERKK